MTGAGIYLLGAANLVVAVYSMIAGIHFSRCLRRTDRRNPCPAARPPSVALFVPCCGAEEGLEENLRALFRQDYPDLEIVFIVEDENDAAAPVIRRLAASEEGRSRLVVAGPATTCSQKIHNLTAGLEQTDEKDVLAFADSDIRPSPLWLSHLVSALERDEVGVATGYRFYIPDRRSLASLLRSAWNAGVMTLLGDHDHNFAWGGSMALRTDVFRDVGVQTAWRGALSDDFVLTHRVRRAGYRVEFVPFSIAASFGRPGFAEVLDWCHRQMSVTRVYWTNLWRIAGGSQVLLTAFIAAAPAAVLAGDRATALILALVSASSAAASLLRTEALQSLGPEWRKSLRRLGWVYVLLVPGVALLTTYAFFRSAFSRRIHWRGKTYEMHSPTETTLVPAVSSDERRAEDEVS